MSAKVSTRRVLLVSFLVNAFDVVSNLVVMLITGSAVVFAAMAQGLADSTGSALLVVGDRRARRPADAKHPFGYAREAFFWGLLSAVAMLIFGAGLSAWRAYEQFANPQVIELPRLAMGVVALAVLTNGYAVSLSFRRLAREHGSLRLAFRSMSEPLIKTALLRDAIGTFTNVVGLLALILYLAFDLILFDALGALIAAVMMTAASVMLMGQARELIAGRALPADKVDLVRRTLLATPGVEAVNELAAVYAGASSVPIDVDLDLAEGLETSEIEGLLDTLEERVRAKLPSTQRIRVELSSPDGLAGLRRGRR